MNKLRFLILPCLLLATAFCSAQSTQMNLPRQSQKAEITQRIGITDITIDYHRPLVDGRKIWGGLVPYGEVWRAGANVNTTITFPTTSRIEGKPLPAGTYGLHMIPNENEWTVIFSKMHTAWGSFSYKESEDALRVTVKPQAADMHNALTYDFDQLKPDSAVVVMSWDKVAVPFKVSVDVNKIVDASLQNQLRGLSQYTWDGWDDAATYLVDNKYDLHEALKWEDNSIRNEDRFENEMTKSRILAAMGQTAEAQQAKDKALHWPMRSSSTDTGVSCSGRRSSRRPSRSSRWRRRRIPTTGCRMPDWLASLRRRELSRGDQANADGAGRRSRSEPRPA